MKIYVGNLGDDGKVTSEDIRPLFEQYGTVSECEVIKNYAFVHIDDETAGNQAVQSLNGTNLNGRQLKVEKSESKGPRKPSQKLFVGNIAEGTTSEELKNLFGGFSAVLEADVIKNYGFVHIDADAGRGKINEIIRELNGHNLNGSNIRVQLSTSGVRQKPGMGGDQCYRCGRTGHWSKECPQYPDYPGPFGPRGAPRGGPPGPMRGGPPYGGRGGPYGGRGGDPYPAPPPPAYMRERMMDDGYGQGPQGGYDDRRGGPMMGGGRDPYAQPARGGDMYDRRGANGGGMYGGAPQRDIGGPGPMRGPDPYASRDPYGSMGGSGASLGGGGSMGGGGGYGAHPSNYGGAPSQGYSTGGYSAAPGGYSAPMNDMYSRRSPGPPPARGYGGGAPPAMSGGGGGMPGGGMPPRAGGSYGGPPQSSYGAPPQRGGPAGYGMY